MTKKNKSFVSYQIWSNDGKQITDSDYLRTARDQMRNPFKYSGTNIEWQGISKNTHHIRKVIYSYIK